MTRIRIVPMDESSESNFMAIAATLIEIMQNNIGERVSKRQGKPNEVEFLGPPIPFLKGKELWFGAVRVGKRYVSYHLMPIYVFTDLLENLSPELKKRMQGKSCFNFTRVDEALFRELGELTRIGYERFQKGGMFG